MTDREKEQARAKLLQEVGKVAGYTVLWRNEGNKAAPEIVRALQNNGLDVAVFRELSARNGFTRACNEMEKERAIDKISQEAGKIVFQFTAKTLKDDRMDYSVEALVTLDTTNGVVTCDSNPQLAHYAQTKMDEKIVMRTANDVTKVVQRLFERNADIFAFIPSSGGVYFVPVEHRDFIKKIESFVQGLGGTFIALPIQSGDPSANKAMKQAVKEGLQKSLKELEDRVAEWDDKTREHTKVNALKEWEVTNFKVTHYIEFLKEGYVELLSKLNEARDKIRSKFVEQSAS